MKLGFVMGCSCRSGMGEAGMDPYGLCCMGGMGRLNRVLLLSAINVFMWAILACLVIEDVDVEAVDVRDNNQNQTNRKENVLKPIQKKIGA